jgi:NADH-quinone oxidoreductase subunit L
MAESLWISILVFSPLIGFVINGLNFKSKNIKLAGGIATLSVAASFVASIALFSKLVALPAAERELSYTLFNWIQVGSFSVDFRFLVDQISGVMILIITGVGSLIHLFSIGYMSHDKSPAKYFSYLNLFVFNMLLLVLGDNLLVMFVGWEGVGLCSYLLIGFWFEDKAKAAAGMKAFVANRIGDAGLLLGFFLLYSLMGTLSISEILGAGPIGVESNFGMLSLACLALFVGATGKSAQIPLYVWLPDAMAGPTPVSALIHAATMVTAGVYMIVRLNPVFMAAPLLMEMIAWIGALTALGAALIGTCQWDIKKVLAYSTVSQLGFMFLALGVGAFNAAMFHLMTHAFFKALMFLGSGSVIHSLNGEQDIRNMGGLKKYMPITHACFVIGWLAIIGAPPFAGFFSKDEILWMTWHSPMGSTALWFVAIVAAALTAFYMTRLMALSFWGEERIKDKSHLHESPPSMTIPLIVLAILSAVGGWFGIPHVIGGALGHIPNLLEAWYLPKLSEIPGITAPVVSTEVILMLISVLVAAASASFAYKSYTGSLNYASQLAQRFPSLYRFIENKFFVDEFYQNRIIGPIVESGRGLWAYVDVNFIDKFSYGISQYIKDSSGGLRLLQNGNLQQYAFYMVVGVLVGLSFLLIRF